MRITAALLLAFSLFVSTLLVPGFTTAQEATIVLQHADVFKELQRPPVKFDHAKHYEKFSECLQCHHIYDYAGGQKKNVWSGEEQRCGECHKVDRDGSKPGLMDAFHDSCTGCHRKMIAEGKKAGPQTCGECHIRGK